MNEAAGRIDDACAMIRNLTPGCAGVLVVVVGHDGDGMVLHATPELTARLPALLRQAAERVERETMDYLAISPAPVQAVK